MSPLPAALLAAAVEIERHAAEAGWDQPARMYALVPTDDLLAQEPDLAVRLALDPGRAAALTPVEQDPLPDDRPLDEVLGAIAWPPTVVGCAVVVERLVLPPAAEAQLPDDPSEARRWAQQHPQRQEVRIVAAVLRDGHSEAVVRVRGHDDPTDLLTGAEVAPGLVEALALTFED